MTQRSLDSIAGLVGEPLGHTEWKLITQNDVDAFATLTGDDQWIHVDVARASETSYGGTIVHGFYLLSLCGPAVREILQAEASRGLNYGLNRVRFIAPVAVGSRIRVGLTVTEFDDSKPEWVTLMLLMTIEQEGIEAPACVADFIVRYYR